MSEQFDAIVVGSRCAGAPVAMLLARKGRRVLLVDKATFPSDTISTHIVHPKASAALARWGLLDRLAETSCPPIDTYAFDFGPFTIEGEPGTASMPAAYCPRRTVLDKLLVDGAVEAGVKLRQGFTVDEVSTVDGRVAGIRGHEPGQKPTTERARIVIGADGRNSLVADTVRAQRYHEKPPLLAAYYTYWSGLPMHGRFETYVRPNRGFAAAPTHDDLTMLVVGWPHAEFTTNKRDVEQHYMTAIDMVPSFAERVRAAKREAPFAGATLPNYFRKPYGPGWILLGDAGYNKDPITAQGIADAFRDAEACASAVNEALDQVRPFEMVMAEFQTTRDEHALPMYEFTTQLATLAPPSPDMQQMFSSIVGNREAMNAFVRMNAGTISPTDFFGSVAR